MEIRTYKQAAALLATRKAQGIAYAKLGNNTYLEWCDYGNTPDAIAVRYHQTDIVTFHPDGRIELRNGGWHTMSTKQNISAFSPFCVYQDRGEWLVNTRRDFTALHSANSAKCPKGKLPPGIVRFVNGMILPTPKWATQLYDKAVKADKTKASKTKASKTKAA